MSRAGGRRSFRPSARSTQLLKKLLEREGFSSAGEGGIPRRDPRHPVPLSYAQERLWFLEQLALGTAYSVPLALVLEGPCEARALAACLEEERRRHAALRTRIVTVDGEARQEVDPPRRAGVALVALLTEVDLQRLVPERREAETRRQLQAEIARPFDLARGPLWRAFLVRTQEQHVLLLNFHHIIADGWSMGILEKELPVLYSAAVAGRSSPLAELPIQYADFAAWQRRELTGAALEELLVWWRERLAGAPPALELPADRRRPGRPSGRGIRRRLVLSTGATARFEALSRRLDATPFMLYGAAAAAFLGRLTHGRDLVLGTPVANRRRAETHDLIGFFVNTLALRIDLGDDPAFIDLAGRFRAAALDAFAHQELPFERLVEALSPERQLGAQPIFQAMLALRMPPREAPRVEGFPLRLRPYPLKMGTAKFDLTIDLTAGSERLRGELEASLDLFDPSTVRRWAQQLTRLLEGIAGDPEGRLSRFELLAAAERHQLLTAWNDTAQSIASHRRVDVLVQRRAAAASDAAAVACGSRWLTYGELARRARHFSDRLGRLGIRPEDRVGVCLERGVDLVTATLGILGAGAAYLPLDPTHPIDRLAFVVDDAAAAGVVVDGTTRHLAAELARPVIDLDTEAWTGGGAEAAPRRAQGAGGDALAYVTYTSGSTGRPKGVAVPHRAVVHLVLEAGYLELGPSDRVAQISNPAFDAFTFEIWGALLNGACLVGLDDAVVVSPPELAAAIRAHRLSALFVTTALFNQVVRQVPAAFGPLSALLFGGEAVEPRWVRRLLEAGGPRRLLHVYGPTENTTFSSWQAVVTVPAGASTVPIGQPIGGSTLHVLGPRLELVPLGVHGELALGGTGLARGYLARPGLTAERFVPDPFAGAGERLYRTLDRARRRGDGAVEFIGRLDHQVKVRGFRIELGEIETELRRHPAVQEAVVQVRETAGERRLVAWLAAAGKPGVGELRAQLGERLPPFMVPSVFAVLDALPLTANGKVDRAALARRPLPEEERLRPAAAAAAPRSAVERVLVECWCETLGLERVGVHDNFFELGGDSILSIRIVARARRQGVRLSAQELFRHQTIAELAAVAGVAEVPADDASPGAGPVPLTPIQRWFFEEQPAAPSHFNQAVLLGVGRRLAVPALRRAVAVLVEHHDALRARFRHDAGWHQVIVPPGGPVPFCHVDLGRLDAEPRRRAVATCGARLQRSFDLTAGPILAAALFDARDAEAVRFFMAAHHLAVDAVSWRILLEDLQEVYEQLERGAAASLPPPPMSFRSWAEALAHEAGSPSTNAELDFWLADGPADPGFAWEAAGDEPPSTARAALSPEETRDLLREVPRALRAGVDEALLAAWVQAWSDLTGEIRLRLDLESHGRQELLPGHDLSRTVGWLTAIYPLTLAAVEDPLEALREIKEKRRAVPRNGIGWGLLRYLETALGDAALSEKVSHGAVVELRRRPAARTSFNYLGRLDRSDASSSLFRLAPEEVGPAHGPRVRSVHALSIDAAVRADRLHITWSGRAPRGATLDALRQRFLERLRRLIAACRNAPPRATPSDFPLAGLSAVELDRLVERYGVPEDLYPLAPLQEGMLFHHLAAPEDGLYFEQIVARLDGELEPETLRQAWDAVIARHGVLRTALVWEALPRPVQRVEAAVTAEWRVEDWRGPGLAERQARLAELLEGDRRHGFALDRAPLLRFTLLRWDAASWRLVWSYHHLLLDGWSLPLVLRELLAAYEALARGTAPALPPPPRPYRDLIAWLEGRDLDAARDFWRAELAGLGAATPVVVERVERPDAGAPAFDRLDQALDVASTGALEAFAQRHHLTLGTVLHGAWALLLGHLAARREVVFGSTTSGRPPELPGVETMVGVFINTLPVRVLLPREAAVTGWLAALQERLAAARQMAFAPLQRIQGWSEVAAGQPLFESLFVFENYPTGDALEQAGTALRLRGFEHAARIDLPLTLVVAPGPRLHLRLAFDARRFEGATVQRLAGHLTHLLAGLAAAGDHRLGEVALLSDGERRQILEVWSGAGREPPAAATVAATVVEMLAGVVHRARDSVALVGGDGCHLSYGELERRADQLAHHLLAGGLAPEDRVAVCLERSPRVAVAFLGVMKAGGAYVPLDPSLPRERLRFLLADAGATVLVTERDLAVDLPAVDLVARRVELDAEAASIARRRNAPAPLPAGGQRAYVIYTSGSTGRPKGVEVEHRSLAARVEAMAELYDLGPDDRQLQSVALGFDVLGEELFVPLARGAAVVFPGTTGTTATAGPAVPAELLADVERRRITKLNLPASYWHQMVDELRQEVPRCLRILVTGAESPSVDKLRAWIDHLGHRQRFFNVYGPTEGTILATAHEPVLDRPALARRWRLPIGRPLAHTRLYVVDRELRPRAPRLAGELLIGGRGVARGYLERPRLTAERFFPDPWSRAGSERLYRTGDLARFLDGGELEFLGRFDHQVKVRGFRIELEEIEAVLAGHPGVRAAAMSVRQERGVNQLVAHVVPCTASAGSTAAWRAFLAEHLPPYMVPAVFVEVAELPTTATGKLDRVALATAGPVSGGDGAQTHLPEAPRTAVEKTLVALWERVLGRSPVGVHDDFFALGGDSILSLRIAALARQEGLRLNPAQVFEHPSVAQLARVVVPATSDEARRDEAGRDEEADPGVGEVPLTPIQHWFFEGELPDPHHWNLSLLLRASEALDRARIERALGGVVDHHDALRCAFERHAAGWRAETAEPGRRVPCVAVDLSRLEPARRGEVLGVAGGRLQSSLDLGSPPLVRAAVFSAGDFCRLLLVVHHLVIDAVSWGIVLDDLEALYRGGALPPTTTSFRRWAQGLTGTAADLAGERDAWLVAERRRIAALPAVAGAGSGALNVSLGAEATAALGAGAAARALLLTAVARALGAWTGRRQLLIDLETHGREAEAVPGADLSRTVGWLTAQWPLRVELSPSGDAARDLESVRAQLADSRGWVWGLLRYLGERSTRAALGELPAAEVSFNYLGRLGAESSPRPGELPAGTPLLSLASEPSGDSISRRNPRRHPLEIDARVVGERLWIRFRYTGLERRAVERLAASVVEAVPELVELSRGAPRAVTSRLRIPGLVGLRPGGEQRPLVLVHPAGGQALAYSRLASRLEDRPVYAFAARGLEGEAEPLRSIDEMAVAYVDKLGELPGPYLLGGWSFGALVALEMGRELLGRGHQVALLANFDQPVTAPVPLAGDDDRRILEDVLGVAIPDAHATSRDAMLAFVLDGARQHGHLPAEYGLDDARRFFDVWRANALMAAAWRPRPYPGSMVLFRAAADRERNLRDPTLGWDRYITGELTVHAVPGRHETLMSEAQVDHLAEALRACLEELPSTA